MDYIRAFIVGGIICVIAQILIDKTKLTPGRILVLYVTLGAILGGIGIYKKLIDIGGAGATIPILGFGNSLAQGAIKAVKKDGITGAFTGGLTATAGGIAAAVFFGYLFSIIFTPKTKK
ncbi:stage V sporulation protein AE [Thermoanaerobacterium sp. RBIITD]|uniref:stage V sporulation protein AE n=1 Tax=Thermoanaerobacterium sp. RBIITD TaxID=1550240 RepID=UPI000BB7B29F|nr:stage V sporulation protein AE [Thermoanaerobacterium sp. RBIITD]SNX55396.1 stage V sporulation protein AE [Thermoanaerobacterium sp. RBIITD]